jgi:hypothetical protein
VVLVVEGEKGSVAGLDFEAAKVLAVVAHWGDG